MSSDDNPRKRPRTSDEDLDEPNVETIQHDDLWFEDGNIVLIASLIASDIAFRVHRSILSRHSHVFRDILTIPQPSDSPTVEDCPVVHLSDSGDDVQYFVNALYDRQ
jgi:hypothetical protein